MRILHLLNDAQNIGNGIINVAVDLACTQARGGHAVALASGGGGYETLLAKENVRHVVLDQRRRPAVIVKAIAKLRRLVREFEPNIVHAHMVTGTVLAWLARGRAGYQLVTTVHREYDRQAVLMGLADRVIVVSGQGRALMRRRGIPDTKLAIVQNGPLGSPRRTHARASPARVIARPAVVTVAGMYRRKGVADLLRAFATIAGEFPLLQLYLVGNGPDRAEFEQQAQRLACRNRIHFEGFQPFPEEYMRQADIFVLASHGESSPLVIAEARAAGAAVIGTAVNGIPALLEQGRAGLLVAPHDPAALAEKLRYLLANAGALRQWQKSAVENLSWLSVERVCTETMCVYGDALQRRSGHEVVHRNSQVAEK